MVATLGKDWLDGKLPVHEADELRGVHGPELGQYTEWEYGVYGVWITDVTPKIAGIPIGRDNPVYRAGVCHVCGGPRWVRKDGTLEMMGPGTP